jgi:hypothetical protein
MLQSVAHVAARCNDYPDDPRRDELAGASANVRYAAVWLRGPHHGAIGLAKL